jgi:predicted metal-dependent hydrolase
VNRTLLLCRLSRQKFKPERSITHNPSPQHPTVPTAESEAAAISHGIELFNSQKFFDAHEAWEAVWLKAKEPDKKFLQGLIQISAAFHHRSRDNQKGFESLLRAGLIKIEHAPSNHRGMDFHAIRIVAREWLKAIEDGGELEPRTLPQIIRVK